uniref:Uncharacterized protein n=1 Tax=Meloidogyne enterolobii TaxID=390850 RepID=A0A6V7WQ34_MELEN|nr:unnamed protein product [Meloidogyne enterolobii]
MVARGGPDWMASSKRFASGGGLVALNMLLVVGGSLHACGGGWWLSTCSWWPADVMLEYGRAQPVVWMVWTKQNVLQWMESVFGDFNINFLIILMTTLLITPTLNSTNLLATSFALHLLKADRSTKKQLFALVSPKDGTKISKSLEPFLEGGQLNILFGSTNSQKIVKRIVEVNEIRAVYVIIDEKSNIADEENNKA